ncbi:MAG: TonB-dependent receptor [Bacteroidales bacterium]|nr:TonB-dependent receptor [Bacteroidales bacterium]MCM1147698.1 TonB-dependent receptor [Bacteroidales bacterium]MCM1206773.1 TonB-dependent receptor [Bacillota bacterium]MCM1510673.1 TonB-dependent receptor [Clostridium sp.]
MQKRIFFLVATVMMMVSSAMAQVTTSGINGKVTLRANGEEVIGATVEAVHVPSGTKYNAVTNAKGMYSIQGMRAGGPYTVTVSYIGAQTKKFENISLQLGESYSTQVWLEDDAQQLGEVVITGQAGINNTRNGAAQSISNRQIQEMPSINHSVADVARINPFVKVTEGGAMSIAGSNNRYNAIQIDGAMANDVFGLSANGSNGSQAGTTPFSMETIDQLQISIAPFDVRQSGFSGGAINAITKSGTNDFHGSVYTYFQNGDLVGNKYRMHDKSGDSADYGKMTDYTIGATLGGPIVKDKLFFFANFERTSKEYDNAYSTDNGMSKIDFGVANDILSIVKQRAEQAGYTYRGTLGNPKEYTYSDKVGVKLDWNINDRNHASLRWSFVDAKQNNNTSTSSNLRSNDYAYDFVSKTNSLVFELQSRIGSNWNNEFHASMTNVRDKRNPGDPFPMIQISGVGNGTLQIGNERSSMANGLDQDIYTLTDNLTWSLGRHAITLGTHDELYKFGNVFLQDAYGYFEYNSVADFKAGNIKRYRYGSGINERIWVPEFSAAQLGFYLQDKWDITNNFQLTYGIRADLPLMLDTPMENKDFNDWAKQNGYDLRTDQKIAVKPMWSPRLGFRWDALNNRNLVVRGGVGIFTGRVPYVWLSNSFSNSGVGQFNYDSNSDKANLSKIENIYSPDQDQNLANLGITPSAPDFRAQTINVFDKDFKFSQQLRADLAVDAKFLGIDWTVEGIYSKTLNDMMVEKLNINGTGETWASKFGITGDNRPMFETKSGVANIYYLRNVSKGYSYNVAVKAEKNFDFGLDLMASYTYSKSKTINNGGSSVAASNWQYNYTHGNPNDPELANSAFNIPHQVMVSAFYHLNWNNNPGRTFDNKTTIGLIYTGNSGSPYNVYVYGDVNGDGGNNDLMYIHTDGEIDALVNAGRMDAGQAATYKTWLAGQDYLKDHRGEFFERNGANEKWENRLDLHFDHKFGFKMGKDVRYLQIGLDILNFTNMLCKKWGATLSQNGYNYYSPLNYNNGKYSFSKSADFDMRSWSDYYSRWRMQLSAKLTF